MHSCAHCGKTFHGRLVLRVTRKVVVNMDNLCLVMVSRRVSQRANGRLQVLHLSMNSSLLLDKKDQDLPILMALTTKLDRGIQG